MKTALLIALFTLSMGVFADDNWTYYGEEFTLTETPIASTTLLADPGQYDGKTILVEGRVADVCQKAGCWLVLAEGDKSIRVRTKAHRFVVAKDGTGKTARIEGLIKSTKIDEKMVAHFEGESANKEIIPEKQAKSDMVFELIASSIAFKK